MLQNLKTMKSITRFIYCIINCDIMKLLLTGILVNALLECLICCAEYTLKCTKQVHSYILAISIAMAVIPICSVHHVV